MKTIKIAPSIAAADHSRLGWAVEVAADSGADIIHLDLEDGVFIPNITFGPATVRSLRPYTDLPFDVHVELADPELYLADLVEAGSDIISVHSEACPYLFRTLRYIKSLGAKAGVAYNAASPLDGLSLVLDEISVIHLMTADTEIGDSRFIPAVLPKIKEAAQLVGERPIDIQVDGGINLENVPQVVQVGATVLIVGRAVWSAADPAQAIAELRSVAQRGT